MANLPPSDNRIAIHLSDRALTPLVSSSNSHSTNPSSQSQTRSQALSSITTTAITAYDSASRLGLGLPQRIMIETHASGPVILHSYLNPQNNERPQLPSIEGQESGRGILEQARVALRPLSRTSDGSSVIDQRDEDELIVNGIDHGRDLQIEDSEGAVDESSVQQPPLLIASVVAASSAQGMEARRAAARLEGMGREFQAEWIRDQEERLEAVTAGDDG